MKTPQPLPFSRRRPADVRPGAAFACFAVLALTALLGASGCAKIKHEMIEDVITKDVTSRGIQLTSVSCPADRPFKDDAFECSGVDKAGNPLKFSVKVRVTDGGKADVRYSGVVGGARIGN